MRHLFDRDADSWAEFYAIIEYTPRRRVSYVRGLLRNFKNIYIYIYLTISARGAVQSDRLLRRAVHVETLSLQSERTARRLAGVERTCVRAFAGRVCMRAATSRNLWRESAQITRIFK